MKCTNIDLLYHLPTSLLISTEMKIKLLRLKSSLVKEAINALGMFYQKNAIWEFDPHVGETSCQIRAYRMFLLNIRKKNGWMEANQKIAELKEVSYKIDKLTDILGDPKNQHLKEFSCHEQLESFMYKNGLVFEISPDDIFLIQSYILSKFKTEDDSGNIYIDFSKLGNEMDISRKIAKKLIHDYQVKIATDSVNFIKYLMKQLPESIYLSKVLNYLEFIDDDARSVLPCYVAMKVLWSHMLKMNTPILLVVKNEDNPRKTFPIILLFTPDQNNQNYRLSSSLDVIDDLSNYPCFVIHGLTKRFNLNKANEREHCLTEIKKVGLHKIIFGNMASHPQYSGSRLSALSCNPFSDMFKHESMCSAPPHKTNFELNYFYDYVTILEREFLEMKAVGSQIGCSERNPALFFIRHIFCDIHRRQVTELGKLEVDNDILAGAINTSYLIPELNYHKDLSLGAEYYG